MSGLTDPVVTFDHAYATYSGQVDLLELWVSSNAGVSYSLLYTWLGGSTGPLNTGGQVYEPFFPTSGQWASKSYSLPANTNRFLFRGVSDWGNNLYLDNISVHGTCTPATSPTAVITPGGPTTFCQGGSVTLTASGGTGYLWSNSATTAAINVSTGGTYTVTVTNSNGCTDTKNITTTVNPLLPVSVSVTPSGNPVAQGTEVTFIASGINSGTSPSFHWKVNGNIVNGASDEIYAFIPENNDEVICVLTSNAICTSGNPASSNTVVMSVITVPVNTSITGIISTGQTECFNAEQTLTVAGSLTTFTVNNGGSATLIAGLNIVYLQGTSVHSGGYMHGYITTNSQFCNLPSHPVTPEISSTEYDRDGKERPWFRIFPNPTPGIFNIDAKGVKSIGNIIVEIFSIYGGRMYKKELSGHRIEDRKWISELIRITFNALPEKKQKKNK